MPDELIDIPPDPVIEHYKRDIDRTLIIENLTDGRGCMTARGRIPSVMGGW